MNDFKNCFKMKTEIRNVKTVIPEPKILVQKFQFREGLIPPRHSPECKKLVYPENSEDPQILQNLFM